MLRSGIYSLINAHCRQPQFRTLGTTAPLLLNQKWRKERGLPLNPSAAGVLTNSPDYTYLDGRLTPYGFGQKKRIMREREVVDKIVHLTGEIDFAVDLHHRREKAEEKRKQTILDRKLKPKGINLLNSK